MIIVISLRVFTGKRQLNVVAGFIVALTLIPPEGLEVKVTPTTPAAKMRLDSRRVALIYSDSNHGEARRRPNPKFP